MRQGFKIRLVSDCESVTAGRSRAGAIKSYLFRISCVLVAACILCPSVVSAAEDADHGWVPYHHIALFAGGGVETESGESSSAGFAFGLIYEYRFHENWGIGAAVDALGQHTIRGSTVAVPVSFHLTEHWRLFAGPGVEFSDHGNEFLIRMGAGYEIPLTGNWTIAPEISVDFVETGNRVFIGGVALGYEF